MRKTLFLGTISAIAVFGLIGCDNGAANNSVSNNANRALTNNANSNTALVVNNNSVNSNSMNMNSTTTNTNSANMANTATKPVAALDDATKEFLKKAAEGGMAEVELGKLAADKGANNDVKDYGSTMVTDHSKANDDLKSVAASKGFTLPTEPNTLQKGEMNDLTKLSGAAFDGKYVKMMVEDHQKDVADFQKEADSGKDPDVKAFAAKTLPVLKHHLEMINAIHGKVK